MIIETKLKNGWTLVVNGVESSGHDIEPVDGETEEDCYNYVNAWAVLLADYINDFNQLPNLGLQVDGGQGFGEVVDVDLRSEKKIFVLVEDRN